jgi:hypothetical protein
MNKNADELLALADRIQAVRVRWPEMEVTDTTPGEVEAALRAMASRPQDGVAGLVAKWRGKAAEYRAGIVRPAKDALDRAALAWASQLDECADELEALATQPPATGGDADLRKAVAEYLDLMSNGDDTDAGTVAAMEAMDRMQDALAQPQPERCGTCGKPIPQAGIAGNALAHCACARITTPSEQPAVVASAEGGECGCRNFCEDHGREFIEVTPDGEEYCHECSADGETGELCAPMAGSCDMLSQKANEFQRSFMCPDHAAENVKFCAECYDERATPPKPASDGEAVALLREVCAELHGVGCGPCVGSHAPMEDLHGRIARYLGRKPHKHCRHCDGSGNADGGGECPCVTYAQPQQSGEGMVLVPREPTEAMLLAVRDWSYKKYGRPIGNDDATGCYLAMLAASAPVAKGKE